MWPGVFKMNKKAIYWRRKEGKIIAEGQADGKTIYLFQLPDILKVVNSSVFSEEKRAKILRKIARLDKKKERGKKQDA